MTDYKSALQQVLDLYNDFKISNDQYITALEALKAKFPDEFEEAYLQRARGETGLGGDAPETVEPGEVEIRDVEGGGTIAVTEPEEEEIDIFTFDDLSKVNKRADEIIEQFRIYNNNNPLLNYQLPDKRKLINALRDAKKGDQEALAYLNSLKPMLEERVKKGEEVKADLATYITYGEDENDPYKNAELKLYSFTDRERELLKKVGFDPDAELDAINKTDDFKQKIEALKVAAEQDGLSEEEKNELLKRADYLENRILREGQKTGYDMHRRKIHDATAPGFFTVEGAKDTGNKFWKTVLDISGGVLRIDNFMNKMVMSIGFEEDLKRIEKEYAGDASGEAKAINDFIANTPMGQFEKYLPSAGGYTMLEELINLVDRKTGGDGSFSLANLAVDIADAAFEKSQEIDNKIFKYELGISETFENASSLGEAFTGLAMITKETIGSLPYMIVSSGGVGGLLAISGSVAAGGEFEDNNDASVAYGELIQAALDFQNGDINQEQYDKIREQLIPRIENGKINITNLSHHALVGAANGLLERFSGQLGRQVFASIKGSSKREIKKGLTSYFTDLVKDGGGEGLTEGMQTAIELLSDYAIRGNEVEFEQAFRQVLDASIVGMSSGFSASGTANSINIIKNGINTRTENNIIKKSGKKDSAELFAPDATPGDADVTTESISIPADQTQRTPEQPVGNITSSQIQFVLVNNSDLRLNADLDAKVKDATLTETEANDIKNNYREVQGAVNTLKNTTGGAAAALNTEAVNLMVEKKKLIDQIEKLKEVSPDAATDAQARLDEINGRLGEIIKETTKENNKKKNKGVLAMSIIPGLSNLVGGETDAIFDLDATSETDAETDAETEGVNETLLGTIKNPNSKKADVNQATDALIENNKALYYNAVGFNPERGDISGKAVMEAIRPRLGPIIKNFDPSKGVTWSTYVTESLGRKKQEIYNEAGIGQQNISLDAEGARQVADTQTEQDTQQDIPQRPKVYPSQLEAVAKVLTPEVRETQNAKVKDEIIRSINDKGVNPKTVATDLISKTREKEIRNVIKGAVGRFGSPEYNQFVDDVVNQDFINSLPLATIKGRFGKLFGIEEISRTPTKNVREGKKDSNFKKQVFRIPKTTPEKLQEIKDYFKANEKRSQSLFSLLAEGAIVEEIQTMRGDTEFMNKLNDVLELKGSDVNAEQFMDQLQKDADQRTKEDTSLDVVEDVLDNMIQGVDSYIESMKGTLSANPITPAARAVKAGLKVFKTVYQKTKSIVKAINAAVNEIYNKLKGEVSKTDIKSALESEITQDNVDNNSVDIDSIIDKIAEKLGVNRGIAYENAVYDAAREVKNALFKVTGVQTEKGGAADFTSEIAGNDFIVELKLDPAKLGSVTFSVNADGSITLAKDVAKSKEAGVTIEKDYTFKEELQKAVAKNKKNIKKFRDRAEQLGQDMKDFDRGIINKDIYNQLKQEGLLNDARSTITMPVDMVREIYQKKSKPVDYINVKGKGLFSFNNTLDLPVDPVTGTVEVNVGYTTSGTIYNTVDGNKVDSGNRTFFFRAEPFKFNDLGKSKQNIDTEAGINKLLKTPSVQILADAQKAKSKIANTASEIVSDKDSTRKVKDVLDKSQEARFKAQEVNKETKGLSAFDFDDTLALTKEKVLYTMPDGTTGSLTASEFAVQAEQLTAEGAEFDFSNFENVDISTLEGPMVGEAKKKQKKFGPKDIFVVTARPGASVDAIHTFLTSIGLNIPKKNITGLGNGDPQAKADWFLEKAAEGYNDFYFSDDSLLNVQQVKNVLDQIDVKSEVQQAIASKEQTLDEQWNKQIEEVTGRKAGETVSDVRAKLEGRRKDGGLLKRIGRQFTITPSAADFLGLLYNVAGRGRQGDRHLKFIDDHLIKPYNKAEQELLSAKVTVAADFSAIKEAFPTLRSRKNKVGVSRNPLRDQIGVGPYTKSHAVRVYLWSKQGTEIPGIDQTDIDALVEAVENDLELLPFAENILLIQKGDGYPAPKNSYWIGGDIASDIINGLDTTYRGELLTEWKQNVDIILSDKNLNKLEAVLGSKWVEAIKDSVSRMTRGSNRPIFEGSGSRQVNDMLDWLNASVGAVMFLNMRSGLLQLISNVNFINWGDNNIYNAAKAFASKDYVPTVIKLMNSDYLVNRRDGLKINVNEAELTEAANKGGIQGMISYLLDKGFVITRIMDSLAIATGGATFFINRQKSLLNRTNEKTGKKYTAAEAEQQAFDDFYAIAEETQQSSNPSKISSQQASYGGRLLLSFQNVTMQYNRKTKKMIQDLYNRRRRPGMTQRESDLSNISGVLYYVGVQNLIFNGLQQALFAQLFDDDDEYKQEQGKTARIANGMLDSLLNGLGFGGAIFSTVKNLGMRLLHESEKKSPKYIDAVDTVFDVSPVLDAKIRKLKSAAKTFEWNMKEIKKRGFNLENPAYLAVSQIVSAFTNIPVDRVLRKCMNIAQAFDEETKTWQTIALLMGWSGWNVGLPYWGLESTIKKEAEQEAKFKEEFKVSVKKAKDNGFTKRVPFTGKNSWKDGIPKGLKEGEDYVAIKRYDGIIQYYKKP